MWEENAVPEAGNGDGVGDPNLSSRTARAPYICLMNSKGLAVNKKTLPKWCGCFIILGCSPVHNSPSNIQEETNHGTMDT